MIQPIQKINKTANLGQKQNNKSSLTNKYDSSETSEELCVFDNLLKNEMDKLNNTNEKRRK